MPAVIGSGVTPRGFEDDRYTYTWNLSNLSTDPRTGADFSPSGVEYALAQDTTATMTARPASGADQEIVGSLFSYENRVAEGIIVGAVKRKGTFKFRYTGTAPTLGQSVACSATPGKVKAASANVRGNTVLEVNTTDTWVVVAID